MKKLLIFIVFIILILIGGTYFLLFTSPGNSMVKPYIEKKLTSSLGMEVKLPVFKLRFSSIDIDSTLKGKKFATIRGNFGIFNKNVDINYEVTVDDIKIFSKIANYPLSGKLATNGKITGTFDNLNVKGDVELADGKAEYLFKTVGKQPKLLNVKADGLKLDKILKMINKPVFSYGDVYLTANITNLNIDNLNGDVVVNVKNGKTDKLVLKKEFDMDNANITYKADAKININKSIANIVTDLNSSVGTINLFDTKFNIKSLLADGKFKVYVGDLSKLYFVTKTPLKGKATITGDFKKDKDLTVNAHSDIFKGKVDINLVNNDLKGKAEKLRLVEVLEMLNYPKIFNSEMNADLNYNLLSGKGKLQAKLLDGRILPNKLSFILKNLAKFDITKEVYKVTTVDSNVNKNEILTDLHLESRLTKIDSKQTYFNTLTKKIDSNLSIMIAKKPLKVKVKGDINKPDISVDVKDYFKGELKNQAEKNLKKYLPKDKAKEASKILNMFK